MSIGHVHLTPQLIAAVRQAVSIVDVAEQHTKLTRRGRRSNGLCPLHKEKSPSFTVDPEQGLFYCFGCGQGGDAIKLHMLLSGDDFPAAIETLARRYGIPLPSAPQKKGERDLESVLEEAARWFTRQLEGASGPREYLERRGISWELAQRYGVGFAPPGWDGLKKALAPRTPEAVLEAAGLLTPSEKRPGERYDRFRNRLMFPIRTASGAIVGFGGRALGPDDKPKYLNTPETERFRKGTLLFGLDQAKKAIREASRAFLVEGYFDVLGAVAAGVEGTVASMGTALTAEQVALLARYCEEVVVGYDGDRAGQEASRRALALLLPAGLAVRRIQLPEGEDPDSLRMKSGSDALQRLFAAAPDAVEHELQRLVPTAPSDPQAQARLAGPIVELLTPVKDPILRWAYGRRAADRLGVPAELLAPRLGRLPGSPPPRRPAEADPRGRPAPGTRSPGRDLEEAALRLLLALLPDGVKPGPLPVVGDLPPLEVFWGEDCRNLFATFRVLYGEGEGLPPRLTDLRDRLEAQGGTGVDLLARLVIEGPDPQRELPTRALSQAASCEDMLRMSLGELLTRWRKQRLRQLTREIHEAQRAGDDPRLQRLVEEKRVLSRAVHLREAGIAATASGAGRLSTGSPT